MADEQGGRFARWMDSLAGTFIRFPLPVLIAFGLTILNLDWGGYIADRAYVPPVSDSLKIGLNWAGGLSFLWTIGAQLWGEAAGQRGYRHAAWLVQGVGMVFFTWFFGLPHPVWTVSSSTPLGLDLNTFIISAAFVAALVLLLGLTPYLNRGADSEAVWQFNHKLWVGNLAAWFGGLVFCLSVIGIIETLNSLFSLDIPAVYSYRAVPISFILVPAMLWLTLVPADFAERTRTGRDMEFTSRAVALLVKFIFVPLLWIFFAILFAYCAKVLAEGGFSEARLGMKAAWYGTCVVITALLAYPTRNSGWFLRLFWRAWPWLLLPSVALLIAAIYIRVNTYGMTVPRYASIQLTLWLAVLAVIFLLRPARANIRLIPGLLALLLLLSTFGPWGSIEMTVRSQKARLEAALAEQGLLKEGRWAGPAPDAIKWAEGPHKQAATALFTLNLHNALDELKPWFEGAPDNPVRGEVSADKRLAEVQHVMNIPANMVDYAGRPVFAQYPERLAYSLKYPTFIPVNGANFVTREILIWPPTVKLNNPINGPFKLSPPHFEQTQLVIETETGRYAKFDLSQKLADWSDKTQNSGNVHEKRDQEPFVLSPSAGDFKVRVVIVSLYGQIERDTNGTPIALNNANGSVILLIDEKPG